MMDDVSDGMCITWDAPITVDDGLVLRADVFRPIPDGRYPALLSYGPYAKGMSFEASRPYDSKRLVDRHPEGLAGSSNKYQAWELLDPEKWVPEGYAIVRVDSRGAGRSPGHVDPWSQRETWDIYECIEWAAAQSWCNGKIGLSGISYYAVNQYQVAALQPLHLRADSSGNNALSPVFSAAVPMHAESGWRPEAPSCGIVSSDRERNDRE